MKRGRVGVKCIDTIQLGQVASLDVGGVGVCLNPFDLGTNFFECRSNRVKIVGIKLRCIVSPLNGETVVTANGVYTCGVQMQVVYDRQSNNPDPFIPPVLTEVFGSVYDGAGFADYLMALQGFPKPYAYQRFISLASQLFVIPTVLPISYEAPYVSDYEGYVVGRPKRYALQNSVEQCAVEKYSDHCAGGIKFGMQYPSINPSFNPLLVEPNQGDQDVVTMTYSEGNFDEQSSWKWVNRVESELEGASQLTGLSEFPAASGGLFLNYPDITVPDGLITDVNVSTTGGGIYSNVTGSGGGGGGGGTVAAGAGVILPALPDNPVTTTVLGTSTNVFSSTPSYADLTISSFAAHYDGSFGTEYTGGGICSIPAGFINDDTGRVLGPALWNRISLTDPSDGGSIPNFQVGIRGQMSASTSYYGRTVNFNIVYMDTFFGTYYCIYEFDPVDEIPESWIIPQDAIIELPEVVQPFPGDFSVLNLTGGRKVKVYSTNYYVESGTDVVVRDFTFLFSSIGDTVLAPEFLPVVCKYPDTYNPIRKEYDNLRLVNHYPVPVGGNALPFMVDPKGRSSWMMDEELDLDEDDLWCDLTGTNGDVPYSGGLWFYIYAGWQGSPDAPPLQYNLTARVFYDDS